MNNYITHAHNEFKAAGWMNDDGTYVDEMQQAICEHVIKLLTVFSDESHSGTSAPYAISLFSKLAAFEPVAALTGEDWEWNEICDDRTGGVTVHQNKRCSAVFKQSDRFDGNPYYLDAVVFWQWWPDPETGEKVKTYYTSKDSMQPIEFPYIPKTEYVYRESSAA